MYFKLLSVEGWKVRESARDAPSGFQSGDRIVVGRAPAVKLENG
jgi:hypothetical protein